MMQSLGLFEPEGTRLIPRMLAISECQIQCQIRGSKGIEGDFDSNKTSNLLFLLSSSSFSILSLSSLQSTLAPSPPITQYQ